MSIEKALFASDLKIKKYKNVKPENLNKHIHIPLNFLKKEFGNKESVCITRDWFEKWLSSLNHFWDVIEKTPVKPILNWEEIDNDFIYKIFSNDFVNDLYTFDDDLRVKCFSKIILNKEDLNTYKDYINPNWIGALLSNNHFKSNEKCTYEFDIKEIDKFALLIEEKFGEKIVIEKTNKSSKRPSKIIVNDELRSFVWEKFEKRFEKRNQLI
jgi:hypothetical protein